MTYRTQQFDLVDGCLRIVLCTLHNLHRNEPLFTVETYKNKRCYNDTATSRMQRQWTTANYK